MLHTISDEFLEGILERNGVAPEQKAAIKKHAAVQRRLVSAMLATQPVEDEIPLITDEEFKKAPPALELSGMFYEKDITYNPEEYGAHLREIKKFEKESPNYTLKQGSAHAFRNLQIFIHQGQWAMVSKGKAPAVHFVIRHQSCEAP